MSKFTDHALCDIILTHDEVYKLRLAIRRQIEGFKDDANRARELGLTSNIDEYLIERYSAILKKLDRSELFWLDRGRFQLRFIEDRGCDHE